MIKVSDVKNNSVEGFLILIEFNRVFIKPKTDYHLKALRALLVVNEIDFYEFSERVLVVKKDRYVKKIAKCFSEILWAEMPKRLYSPLPLGTSIENESGYGTDFIIVKKR